MRHGDAGVQGQVRGHPLQRISATGQGSHREPTDGLPTLTTSSFIDDFDRWVLTGGQLRRAQPHVHLGQRPVLAEPQLRTVGHQLRHFEQRHVQQMWRAFPAVPTDDDL